MSVRPLRPEDQALVNQLHRDVGWHDRSYGGWRWLDDNPARQAIGAPAGWVVTDATDAPAAFVGNLVQRFWLGDRVLFGATGFNLIVPPEQRGRSRGLLKAFLGQPGLFAAYTFNANPRSAPLYGRYGMKPWPPTHAVKLSWVVDPLACMEGRLWRAALRTLPDLAPRIGERLMNPRLGVTPRLTLAQGVGVLTDLGDRSRYADYWTALKHEGRLVADRGPEILRWRLADPDQTRRTLMLSFNRGRRITGCAMAVLAKGASIDPPFLEIVDLTTLEDEAEAVPALVETLIANARALGAAKVRLQVASPEMLDRLGPLASAARREGGWGHCHVRFADDAPDPALWAPTPYDGDYGVCLRPPPVEQRQRASPWVADKRRSTARAGRGSI